MIQTICKALHCWHAVISHNDATGPQCFWLLKLHVQIILKKLRRGYSRKLVFGWHLSMRRPPSTWGRVRACMFHQSQSREHRSMCLSSVALKFCAHFFSLSHRCGCPGANATVIFIPQKLGADTFVPLASLYECCLRFWKWKGNERGVFWSGLYIFAGLLHKDCNASRCYRKTHEDKCLVPRPHLSSSWHFHSDSA